MTDKKPTLTLVSNEAPEEEENDVVFEEEDPSKPDLLLRELNGQVGFEALMILGISKEGFPILAASEIDTGTALVLMERMKHQMMQSMDEMLSPPEGPLN